MMNESAGVWRTLLQIGKLQRVITEEQISITAFRETIFKLP
jgi:hypothetical protein